MSKSSFEEQIMQGAYALGRQRDQLASENEGWQGSCAILSTRPASKAFQSNTISGWSSSLQWEPFRSSCSTQTAAPKLG